MQSALNIINIGQYIKDEAWKTSNNTTDNSITIITTKKAFIIPKNTYKDLEKLDILYYKVNHNNSYNGKVKLFNYYKYLDELFNNES
jgi:hypothetical protein